MPDERNEVNRLHNHLFHFECCWLIIWIPRCLVTTSTHLLCCELKTAGHDKTTRFIRSVLKSGVFRLRSSSLERLGVVWKDTQRGLTTWHEKQLSTESDVSETPLLAAAWFQKKDTSTVAVGTSALDSSCSLFSANVIIVRSSNLPSIRRSQLEVQYTDTLLILPPSIEDQKTVGKCLIKFDVSSSNSSGCRRLTEKLSHVSLAATITQKYLEYRLNSATAEENGRHLSTSIWCLSFVENTVPSVLLKVRCV